MLLDSYAWVELFSKSAKGARVREIIRRDPVFTSLVSIAELSDWAAREGVNRKAVLAAIQSLSRVLPLDEPLMEAAGLIKNVKRQTMRDFGLMDAIIVATGRAYGLPIVTGDAHFKGENTVFLD